MAETKRGYAMLIHGGDAEIGAALKCGIMAAHAAEPVLIDRRHPRHMRRDGMISEPATGYVGKHIRRGLQEAEAFTDEEKEEIRRRRVALSLRQEMHPVPVDYIGMLVKAELEYGQTLRSIGRLKRARERMLIGYAVVVMAFDLLFRKVGVK